MSNQQDTQLKIEVLRNETAEGGNTRNRVATILTDLNNNKVNLDASNLTNPDDIRSWQIKVGGLESGVVTIGDIEYHPIDTIELKLHSSGVNSVIIDGSFYSKIYGDIFDYTPPTGDNLKVLIIYALPTNQIFYIAEGVAGLEAVEPTLPQGALIVRRIVTSGEGAQIDPPNLDGYKLKEEDNWKTITASTDISLEYSDSRQNFLVSRKQPYSTITEIGVSGIIFSKDVQNRDVEFKIFNNVENLVITLTGGTSSGNFKAFKSINSGKQIKYGDCAIVKYDASDDKIFILQVGGGSATGNYIPLSGTEVGKPVTGDIELEVGHGRKIKAGNKALEFTDDEIMMLTNDKSVLGISDTSINIYSQSDTSNYSSVWDENKVIHQYIKYNETANITLKRNNVTTTYDSGYGVSSSVVVSSFQTELNFISGDDYSWLRNSQRGVTIGSTVANAYGILGDKDYSTATTGFTETNRLLYVQRAYLENYQSKALVTSWSTTPTDTNYPSEKLVKDSIDANTTAIANKVDKSTTTAQTVASPITFSNALVSLTGLTDSTTFNKVLVRNSDNTTKTADTIEIFASDGTTTKFTTDAALNAAYPNAVEGFELMCANIITTNFPKGVIYKKMATGWKPQKIYDLSDV